MTDLKCMGYKHPLTCNDCGRLARSPEDEEGKMVREAETTRPVCKLFVFKRRGHDNDAN